MFCHIIPTLVNHTAHKYLNDAEQMFLRRLMGLFIWYKKLKKKYGDVDTDKIRGYHPYKNASKETDFNDKQIKLTSAALLQLDMSVFNLVHYIDGPHKATHRDVKEIQRRISHLDDKTIDEYMERIIYGALQVCDAYSSDKNFMAYYKYRNHKSVEKEEDEFRKR